MGIGAGVALATVRLNLPIVAGGVATVLLAIALLFLIREEDFVPIPREGRREIEQIHREQRANLESFAGDPEPFSVIRPCLEGCLCLQVASKTQKKKQWKYVRLQPIKLKA